MYIIEEFSLNAIIGHIKRYMKYKKYIYYYNDISSLYVYDSLTLPMGLLRLINPNVLFDLKILQWVDFLQRNYQII